MASSTDHGFRWLPAMAGLAIGALLCCSNMYFGLQTGWVTMGSIQSALLGFLLFRRRADFSATDNVLLQTVAVAAATLPLAGGFVGVVPALAKLAAMPAYQSSEAALLMNWWQLSLWGLALAFFGVFVAVPLRWQAILREQLPFPSGAATAKLISLFHRIAVLPGDEHGQRPREAATLLHRDSLVNDDDQLLTVSSDDSADSSSLHMPPVADDLDPHGLQTINNLLPFNHADEKIIDNTADERIIDNTADYSADERIIDNTADYSADERIIDNIADLSADERIIDNTADYSADKRIIDENITDYSADKRIIDYSADYSADYSPISDDDDEAAWQQRWKVLIVSCSVSALYGFLTAFIPFLGNIPLLAMLGAKQTADWGWNLTLSPSNFGQGMIMGVRVAGSMLLGSVLGWAIIGPVALLQGWVDSAKAGAAWLLWISLALVFSESVASLLVVAVRWLYQWARRQRAQQHHHTADRDDIDPAPAHQRIAWRTTLIGVGASGALAWAILTPMMDMPWYEVLVALAFSGVAAVLAVRSLGTTDMNPVSAISKLAQLLFAVVAPHNPVSNLVAGAVSEAAGMQAGDLCQDFKTGHLLRASPLAQFYGQLLGAGVSVVFSVAAFALFSSAWTIGGTELPAPTASIWLNMALLSSGEGVSAPHVLPFCLAAAALVLLLVVASAVSPVCARYAPSAVGLGIGFMIPPRFVLPRFAGAVTQLLWHRYDPHAEANYMVLTASGLVLGEGVMAIICALLIEFGVPIIHFQIDLN